MSTPTHCPNCQSELHGRFCHECGQKAAHGNLGLHDFFHEATHEFLHLDGKILKTVKLLMTKPGLLTKEFVEGRRARYISPLRVYLTFSVLFFFLAAAVPGARESFIKIRDTENAAEKRTEEVGEALMHNMPRAAFLLMPAFALLTWAFYRRLQPYYIPHLYYSVHFHAFVFLVLSVAMLLGLLGSVGKGLGSLAFLTVFPYHYIALRRVYGGTRGSTLAKGTAIGILYWIILSATMLALAWTTFRVMG